MVLYRKFRPTTFAAVKGQEVITDTLRSAIVHNKVSHAYLFTGTRGTGKTSTARIFAKAVNCESPKGGEPCNICTSCVSFNGNINIDLIEIDAASNRGIDDIREIKEKINFAPTVSKYKIYIIDEVHMLTKDAFNALLKTLEEPPSSVIFILATTEVYKIPLTVISRCQRFDFKNADDKNLSTLIGEIAEKESIHLDNDTILLISDLAEGSFRDALSILEKLYSHEGKITYETAAQILGIPDVLLIKNVLAALYGNNVLEAITQFKSGIDKGMEVYQFTRSTLHILEKSLMKAVIGKKTDVPLDVLMRYVKAFVEADEKLKSSALPRIVIEATLIELAGTLNRVDIQKPVYSEMSFSEPLKKKIKKIETIDSYKEAKDVKEENEKINESTKITEVKAETITASEVAINNGIKIEDIQKVWGDVISEVTSFNHHLGSFLSQSNPVEIEGNQLILEVKYTFHKDRIEDIKGKNAFADVLQKILGVKFFPKCRVNPKLSVKNTRSVRLPVQIEKKEQIQDNRDEKVPASAVEEDILAEAMKIFEIG